MKKILVIVMLLTFTLALNSCKKARTYANCDTPDGSKACFNATDKVYRIEDALKNGTLRFGADNDTWGAKIVAMWDAAHPEFAGKVQYVNNGSQGAAARMVTQAGEAPDVVFVIDGEVSASSQQMMTLDPYMSDFVKTNGWETDNRDINNNGYIYVPITYDGMAFSWNKTMLTALNFDLKDSNNDNLPDAFDTWEELFAIGDSWATTRPTYKDRPVNVVFPISLTEVWSGYSSLTAGGWGIFPTDDPTYPGYDKPEFLKGLQFIQEASKHHLSVETGGVTTPGSSMTNRWDSYLNDEFSPFSLVGTWMNVKNAESTRSADFQFSAMPTYKGVQLTPFVKTKGFVINAATKYPSAAHELLRLIYSQDGFKVMTDNTSYIPSLSKKSKLTATVTDENVKQMSAAFSKSYVEPQFSLPENATVPAMNAYYSITLDQVIQQVWDGTVTPEQAQTNLTNLANTWITNNNKAQ